MTEIAGTESRLSGSTQVEFSFLMVGVDGHGCYGRATRVIGETDFARQFATLAVLPPLLLHERLDYDTPGLHTGGK